MYKAKVIADSLAENGCRLTTIEATYPLIIHAEIMTHRMFSRNVASNRAIPSKRLIEEVKNNPFVPDRFPKNKPGMQNDDWLEGYEDMSAEKLWLLARKSAIRYAKNLSELGVHKQITNRLLSPFLWTTAVITATDWSNFFTLRCDSAAQPEIQIIAYMMKEAYTESQPVEKLKGEWHLPYVLDAEKTSYEDIDQVYISAGRCARVSYLTHGENNTPEKDIELTKKLVESRHLSPLEHPAMAQISDHYSSNFKGWYQMRKFILNESGE